MKRCALTLPGDDSKPMQFSQVSYMGRVVDVEVMQSYGFCSSPPTGSLGVLFDINNTDSQAAILNKHNERFKNLKEWEVQIGNFKTQASIKFENANTIIDAKSGKIEIRNNSEELLSLVADLIAEVKVISTIISGGSSAGAYTISPANIANFAIIETRLNTLKS